MGISADYFFPMEGEYFCKSASEALGRDIFFSLKRIDEKLALRIQKEIADLPDDIESITKTVEKSKEMLSEIIIGWRGFEVEFSADNLAICIEQLPVDAKIEIAMAAAKFGKTGILEDKRSKNPASSPS